MIYNYVLEHVGILRLTSMPKGIGTGKLAGVVVWGVLFLPMHYFVIQPALSIMANGSNLNPDNLNLDYA